MSGTHTTLNDAGCSNTLRRKHLFRIQVNENTGAMTRVHAGRDGRGVASNQDGGAGIAV